MTFLGEIDSPIDFAKFGLDRSLPEWVPLDGPKVVHLGPGNKHVPHAIELEWPNWNAEVDDIPCTTGTVDAVFCTHFLEHLTREAVYHVLREAGRVLRVGSAFTILVPHGQSLMYLQDLDHKTPFVIETWKTLLNNPYYLKDKNQWPMRIGANFLFGVNERNLALVTQLVREASWSRHGQ